MSDNSDRRPSWVQVLAILLPVVSAIAVAYIGYLQATEPERLKISITQTAEARLTAAALTLLTRIETTSSVSTQEGATVPISPTIISSPESTVMPTTPAPIGNTKVSAEDGMILHLVPAGRFTMGSNANDNEKPPHEVELLAFWIDETEVTNEMYSACVATGICSQPIDSSFLDNPAYKNHPVVFVRWQDARIYCEWAGRRLPTEAEWEKAARGTDTRAFPWGNAIPTNQLANFNGTGTTAVGRYPKGASPYGVLDMTGNVWEWVSSLYKSYPYNFGDGRENLNSTDDRVLRGSSWYNDITNLRLTYRGRSTPNDASNRVGFRCALSAD